MRVNGSIKIEAENFPLKTEICMTRFCPWFHSRGFPFDTDSLYLPIIQQFGAKVACVLLQDLSLFSGLGMKKLVRLIDKQNYLRIYNISRIFCKIVYFIIVIIVLSYGLTVAKNNLTFDLVFRELCILLFK